MLLLLKDLSYLAVGINLFLFFFADIFVPNVKWFHSACSEALGPTLITAGVLMLLNVIWPRRIR